MIRHSSRPGLAAALATIAILLAACTGDADDEAPDDPRSTPTETAPTETAPTEAAPTETAPSQRGWTPVPAVTDEFLPPGRLGMTANGRPDAPWAVVEVPPRFSTIDGWVLFDEDPKGGGGVGYWTISEVVRDPCSGPDPMDVGSSVEELAAAFMRQRLTRVTSPVPVTVDGYRGLSLELHVPKDINFADCPTYNVWESDPAGARHMESPGDFDRLWMLDVEGDVVVLTVTADPDVPKSALDNLTRMVESVDFVARD